MCPPRSISQAMSRSCPDTSAVLAARRGGGGVRTGRWLTAVGSRTVATACMLSWNDLHLAPGLRAQKSSTSRLPT